MSDEKHVCAKCGKSKSESEGIHRYEGDTYCCEVCCGDTSLQQHKEKVANTCEFC